MPPRELAAPWSSSSVKATGRSSCPVNLIESASQMVENVIHEIQIHALETIFRLSAEQIAGQRTPGKPSGEIRWHGSQPGKIKLTDREVKVKRPRLRHKSEGEVKVPAYEKLRRDRGLQQHMLGALMRGVSTREYNEVLLKNGGNGGRFAHSVMAGKPSKPAPNN